MSKKNKLSVVLATYNEEKNIRSCLRSVAGLADEIVVVDGFSQDKTAVIAKEHGARVFKVKNRLMFHKNKQLALDRAKENWVLQLDADERVSHALAKEIKKVVSSSIKYNAFYIPRKNLFLGHFLKKGGQYPDYVIRLLKKGKAYFPCKTVHEQIKVEGKVGYLKNDLIHIAYPSLKSYFKKSIVYTSETALKLKKEGVKINLFTVLKYLVFKPSFTFFNIFLRHKGFVDGIYGFLFAFLSGFHFITSYIKLIKLYKAS